MIQKAANVIQTSLAEPKRDPKSRKRHPNEPSGAPSVISKSAGEVRKLVVVVLMVVVVLWWWWWWWCVHSRM